MSEQVQLTDVLGVLRSMQAVMATGDDIRALETRMDQMATKEDFRTLETRMDQVDAGIDLLAIKLDRVDSRMDRVDAGIDLLAIKLDRVDSRMDQMDTGMDQMTTKEDFHALGVIFEEQRDHFKIICEVVTGCAERFDRLENRVTPLKIGRGSVRRGR